MGNDRKEYQKEYYEKNKANILNKRKLHYSINKENKLAKQKQYRKEHNEIIVKYNKKYYNTIVGRAHYLHNGYIRQDRKQGRIGKDLPKNYVTLSDVVRLITKKCAHFDKCGSYGWKKIGLNRLDNSKPHTIDNVEPCCWECNRKFAAEEKRLGNKS